MMINPILHRILVKPFKLEEVDETYKKARAMGLAIPEDAKEYKREQQAVEKGIVLKVGSTCFKDYGESVDLVNEGDTVIYAKYAGKWMKQDGEDVILLNDEDCLAIERDG
jgi:co-chaperonin GroES (HSP10)